VAWLHAKPYKSDTPRVKTIVNPELPNLYGTQLIEKFFRFREITYSEIESWCNLTKTELTSWEVETLVMLSGRYDAMRQKASKPGCPPPYQSFDAEKITQRIDNQWDQLWSMAGG